LNALSTIDTLINVGPGPAFMAISTLAGAAVMLAWRYRESRRPMSARTIVLPPIAMSTGLAMFAVPATRVPWSWAAAAFLLGLLVLAVPLARSSRLVREGGQVLMQRSRAFLLILLALLALRVGFREYVGGFISPMQTAGVLYLLAFGMIVRWRAGMFLQFRRLCAGAPA
jgi:membrane protein CcdC involved in cytochrome C biogenesis